MPHSLESAKKKANGIVKVQISLGDSHKDVFPDAERAVLIYDQKHKTSNGKEGINLIQPITKGVDEAMGSNLKAYFYYRINKKGLGLLKKEIELLHEAPPQSW